VEPPSIAYLLERMEQEGWVVRSTDKTDRRSKRTRATDKARTIREEIMAVSRQVESEVFANLTPETYCQIQQNLLQLRDALEKTHPPATDDHQGLKLS
jgi:DNA-binding MarR family transcriptional regulator